MRSVRFLVKKRGDRRTGSPAWAVAGSLLIYGLLIVIGLGIGGALLKSVVLPEWTANHDFLVGRATVTGKSLGVSTESGNCALSTRRRDPLRRGRAHVRSGHV
ncbi:MAG: hypothetical protein QM811_24165 [Pirellulales bacterium]